MNTYLALYYVHVVCVVLSGSFFVVRGIWMWQESQLLEHKFVRISPHVNDTLLLVAALGLAWMSMQWPFTHDWLTAKLFALLAYIVLGVFALRRGKTKEQRGMFFLAAVLSFLYMVSVALSRDVTGPVALARIWL